MQTHELYRKYREKLEELSQAHRSQDDQNTEVISLMRAFEAEASRLEPLQARQLCEELCDQLEHEAAYSVSRERRNVMLYAAKIIEMMPVASMQK